MADVIDIQVKRAQAKERAALAASELVDKKEAIKQGKIDDKKNAAAARRHQAVSGGLIYAADGVIADCLANVIYIMQTHPEWRGVLIYDELGERIARARSLPGRPLDKPRPPGEWADDDTTQTMAWFTAAHGIQPSRQWVEQAAGVVARGSRYHPVQDYLRGLVWDGVPRLDTWLVDMLGAESCSYSREVGRMWLVSAVARAMRPGCQADHVLILEGAQGIGKSTALRALFGSRWFADTALKLGDKDALQGLRGKWLIELAELASVKGSDNDKTKQFISAPIDHYRPSYGRKVEAHPRSMVFAGTINREDGGYLKDATGGRRFWPVECQGSIDVEAVGTVRGQLWAEAYGAFVDGETWWPDTPALVALCESAQQAREVADPWQPVVQEWLSVQVRASESDDGSTTLFDHVDLERLTAADILRGALGHEAVQMNAVSAARLGRVMGKLNWISRRRGPREARERFYYPRGGC